ncbi:hypothetical protein [Ruania alba]|uniref:Uncharacterized protein n=1 Tax=Ruania alba TaxID=648782 RepID=A0A1H5L2M1_9MICO|nr:hypothetical protein [Ruania alba]SEE71223.1 hypothetical protein SAMN04488554_2580 [Ruania alba]
MNPPAPFRLGGAPMTLSASITLSAAATDARTVATATANLEPTHWQSPAARAYTRRVRDLAAAIEAAAADIDLAASAARVHEAELDHVRQALLTGGPTPV